MKKVYLVGIGMGNPDTLTLGAQRAVEESQLVIGARRLVDAFPQFEGERLIMIKSSDIAQAIHESVLENWQKRQKTKIISIIVVGSSSPFFWVTKREP